MSDLTPIWIALAIPVGFVLLYAVTRIIAAAWYRSKRQFDNHP